MGEEQMFGIFHPAFIPVLTFQDHKIKKVDFSVSPYLRLMSERGKARDEKHMAIQSYRLNARSLR